MTQLVPWQKYGGVLPELCDNGARNNNKHEITRHTSRRWHIQRHQRKEERREAHPRKTNVILHEGVAVTAATPMRMACQGTGFNHQARTIMQYDPEPHFGGQSESTVQQ